MGWDGSALFAGTTQLLRRGFGPGGWWWDAANNELLGGAVGVALDPHGWDPADLVVEAGTRADSDVAEVPGAQVRDGGCALAAMVCDGLGLAGVGEAAAEVEDADAHECAVPLADADGVAPEGLAQAAAGRLGGDRWWRGWLAPWGPGEGGGDVVDQWSKVGGGAPAADRPADAVKRRRPGQLGGWGWRPRSRRRRRGGGRPRRPAGPCR